MSAIEMMDPKMDAGMLCNRGNPKPLNFQQAVAVSTFNFFIYKYCMKMRFYNNVQINISTFFNYKYYNLPECNSSMKKYFDTVCTIIG